MKDFKHFGIKRRIFPKHNYDAIWFDLKTTRFDHTPGDKVNPAKELPADQSEFYDVSLGTVCTTGKCPFCFPADTEVITDQGLVKIQEVTTDMKALSYNELLNGIEFAQIDQLHKREYKGKMYKFHFGAARMSCTANHPIYVINEGESASGRFIAAEAIEAEMDKMPKGKHLMLMVSNIPYACRSDNYYGARELHAYDNDKVVGRLAGYTWCSIDSIETYDYDGNVYNIGVQHNHNYFADGVLVHNCYVAANPNGQFYENVCDTWKKWMSTFFEKTVIKNGIRNTLTTKALQIAIGSTGEPTEHPEFCEFLKTVYETNVVPNYTTNGVILSEDSDRSEKILEYTRKYVGGVAVSFGNEHLRDNARKAVQKLIDHGDCHINLHHIISTKESVDNFVDVWKEYGDNIKYHVLLPLMPSGRSTKGIEDGVFEYMESKIQEYDMKNVAFGAHFVKYLKDSKIKTWLYEPESFSKNVLLKKDHVVITPSSFNMKPVVELIFKDDHTVEKIEHRKQAEA